MTNTEKKEFLRTTEAGEFLEISCVGRAFVENDEEGYVSVHLYYGDTRRVELLVRGEVVTFNQTSLAVSKPETGE